MIKLYEARSLLYRRQNLQENIRWKALDEIYKIYMLLHRSDLNISENFRQFFFAFFGKILHKFVIFEFLFIDFCSDFHEILFGSQEVQKMNMKMEIRKRKMGMIQKETF